LRGSTSLGRKSSANGRLKYQSRYRVTTQVL
jgi:hypothetical protein